MNKEEKYLPLGSIVAVKGVKSKLMIIGYCNFIKADKKKLNDYVACLYPEGMLNLKEIFAFKHEQIERIIHEGYCDTEAKKIKDVLKVIDIGRNFKNEKH